MVKRIAALLSVTGAAIAVVGVGLIYIPAAIILAGVALAAVGLLVDLEALRR